MSDDAQRKGISGVPFTIINGKWAVGGGQEPDVYVKVRFVSFRFVFFQLTLLPSFLRYEKKYMIC